MVKPEAPPHVIREMKVDDIEQVLDVWKELGLEESTHSLHTWLEVDPHGFYVAADDEKGKIYGMCGGVINNDDLAFVGMYGVRKQFQGMGIGIKIWNAVMKHIGDRNAGLNAVPEHLHTYRDRAGFLIMEDWNTIVYKRSFLDPSTLIDELEGIEIVAVTDDIVDKIIDFDATVHGYRRDRIVSIAVKEEDTVCLAAVKHDGGDVCGYGSFHLNNFGNIMVGPLYADEADIAELLMRKLIEAFPIAIERGLMLMTLDCNRGAIRIMKKLDLKADMVVPRCYRKAKVPFNKDKVFVHHSINFSPC